MDEAEGPAHPRSGVRTWDALVDALTSVGRHPGRVVLSGFGVIVGIAALVSTVGLVQTAGQQVSADFNALAATQLTFQASTPNESASMSVDSAGRLLELPGVVHAGVFWTVNNGATIPTSASPVIGVDDLNAVDIPFSVASAGALQAMNLVLRNGRAYDAGADQRHDRVCLLGASAAKDLGIYNLAAGPAIFVSGTAYTVIGIVTSAAAEGQATLGAIVPPSAAAGLEVGGTPTPQLIAQVKPGAARRVAAEAPYLIDPYHPKLITADAPPDPGLFKAHIASSITSLLAILGALAFMVGLVSIATSTLLSVLQRTSELGLRRALGAHGRHLLFLIMSEASLVGLIGGIAGTAIGVIVVASASAAQGWTPIITPWLPVAAPLAGTVAGALAGVYPAYRALRLAPVASMRRG